MLGSPWSTPAGISTITDWPLCAWASRLAQGLLQYLAVAAPKLVWDSFGSWLRTIRPGIPPSELVVAEALRQTLPDFLLTPSKSNSLSKFIAERQDAQNMRIFRLAS